MSKPYKYELPGFLDGIVTQAKYNSWLHRRAVAHIRRDRKRGNSEATNEQYKAAIHRAIQRSNGQDQYTGERLDWSLIGTYDNVESRLSRREYKARFAMMPTVDHIGDGLGAADFAIASWKVNNSKAELDHLAFVDLCRRVVAYHDHELDEVEFGRQKT